jgi:hypothetical protein
MIGKISGLLGFYAIYVFLAGWTFLNVYFRSFGLDPRWITLASIEVPMKAVTAVFAVHGWSLAAIYMIVVVTTLVLELSTEAWMTPLRRAVCTVILALMLPLTFYSSWWVGLASARLDKTDKTGLEAINFTFHGNRFAGKLLFVESGKFFVHDLQQLTVSKGAEAHNHSEQLSIFRAEEISDVSIIEPE